MSYTHLTPEERYVIYHLVLYSLSLREIGTHFGIGESGVSQASRRVSDKIRSDKKLRRKIRKIEKKFNV